MRILGKEVTLLKELKVGPCGQGAGREWEMEKKLDWRDQLMLVNVRHPKPWKIFGD